MADHRGQDKHDAGSGDGRFDLSQFYQIFFEEAAENLDELERLLLSLDLAAANDEELNAVFRCAHSIKGGAATFGFADIAGLTHHMESLLDRLRRHEVSASAQMVDVLLAAADAGRCLLARHQGGETVAAPEMAVLIARMHEMTHPQPVPAAVEPGHAQADSGAGAEKHLRALHVVAGPLATAELAADLSGALGQVAVDGLVQELEAGFAGCHAYVLQTTASDEELRELLAFHVGPEQLQISETTMPGAPTESVAGDDEDFGLFDDAPGLKKDSPEPAEPEPLPHTDVPYLAAASQPEATSIRVAVGKVDQLVNLVGELVITQAMLAQHSTAVPSTRPAPSSCWPGWLIWSAIHGIFRSR